MLEVYELIGGIAFVGLVVVYVVTWLVSIIVKEIDLWRK